VGRLQSSVDVKAGDVYSYNCPLNSLPACIMGYGSETADAGLEVVVNKEVC
jgi:hypothetical protein